MSLHKSDPCPAFSSNNNKIHGAESHVLIILKKENHKKKIVNSYPTQKPLKLCKKTKNPIFSQSADSLWYT